MTLELGRKFPALREELPEARSRPAQPRLDGADGNAFCLGGFLIAETLDVAEHDDDALVIRERLEALLDDADGLGAKGGLLGADLPIREAGLLAALLDDHVQRRGGTPLATP